MRRKPSPQRRPRRPPTPPDRPAVPEEIDGVATPPDLVGLTFRVGPDEFAVLSFPVVKADPPRILTVAEREIVAALLQGKSNDVIARERDTSARTVANQVQNIFRKLSVGSRAELAARCARASRFEP